MNMNYEYKLYLNLDILSGNSKRLCCKSTRETKVSCVNFKSSRVNDISDTENVCVSKALQHQVKSVS